MSSFESESSRVKSRVLSVPGKSMSRAHGGNTTNPKHSDSVFKRNYRYRGRRFLIPYKNRTGGPGVGSVPSSTMSSGSAHNNAGGSSSVVRSNHSTVVRRSPRSRELKQLLPPIPGISWNRWKQLPDLADDESDSSVSNSELSYSIEKERRKKERRKQQKQQQKEQLRHQKEQAFVKNDKDLGVHQTQTSAVLIPSGAFAAAKTAFAAARSFDELLSLLATGPERPEHATPAAAASVSGAAGGRSFSPAGSSRAEGDTGVLYPIDAKTMTICFPENTMKVISPGALVLEHAILSRFIAARNDFTEHAARARVNAPDLPVEDVIRALLSEDSKDKADKLTLVGEICADAFGDTNDTRYLFGGFFVQTEPDCYGSTRSQKITNLFETTKTTEDSLSFPIDLSVITGVTGEAVFPLLLPSSLSKSLQLSVTDAKKKGLVSLAEYALAPLSEELRHELNRTILEKTQIGANNGLKKTVVPGYLEVLCRKYTNLGYLEVQELCSVLVWRPFRLTGKPDLPIPSRGSRDNEDKVCSRGFFFRQLRREGEKKYLLGKRRD